MSISLEEQKVINGWKKRGIIECIDFAEEVDDINNSIFCGCSDDLIDACCHVRKNAIGISPVRHFGMPFIFAPSFRRFRGGFAWEMLDLIREGMEHKQVNTILLNTHFPCGMLMKYGHSIDEIPKLTAEVKNFVSMHLPGVRIIIHFHLRKIKDGKERQVTYRMIL